MNGKTANRLAHETSPYLRQHAFNPVDWYPWGDEALGRALQEDKPIFLSIGYSACHWCHVMERESFENTRIADFLNKEFISIKVDREEKPDVDHVYMDAVLAMGSQGGWPLSVFLTPEQKPFFGGTYFPPKTFLEILENVKQAFINNREKLNLSAEELANHLARSEVMKYGLTNPGIEADPQQFMKGVEDLSRKFDPHWGGFDRAPKFPMPSIWRFLLRYSFFFKDESYSRHSLFTLLRMARGGIYDQAGGGFARYSVDGQWFVPHFEKMLYDNGQLLSLFSEAYMLSGNEEIRQVILETVEFLVTELKAQNGGFFSALDADSEGSEGKYYIWTEEAFAETVGPDTPFWAEYFGVTTQGNWEHGANILIRTKGLELISEKFSCDFKAATRILRDVKDRLLKKRMQRVKPGLDDKILAGWNGIILSGLADAYKALLEEKILELALENAYYLIESHLRQGQLFRTSVESSQPVAGYLEDYAFVIQAFNNLYQVTFDESWLTRAKELLEYTLENFFDLKEGFFYYSDKNTKQLIAAKKEIFDHVIPSSNSVMAENLYLLGMIFDEANYIEIARGMVNRMARLIESEPEYASNWGSIYLRMTHPMAEIAIIGQDASHIRDQINRRFHPNKICLGTGSSSELPLLKGRKNIKDNTIYVCYDRTCKLPVHSAKEALELLV